MTDTMAPGAIPVERGCGEREQGAVYLEVGLSPVGLPLSHFLVDPPVAVECAALGLSPVGVTLIEREGVTHVLDWVGSTHYENVADFVEETRRFGLSRRLPQTLDFARLGPLSRIILVHGRAHIDNAWQYADALIDRDPAGLLTNLWSCPKRIEGHGDLLPKQAGDQHPNVTMCCGLWWEDVEGGDRPVDPPPPGTTARPPRTVLRRMPSFWYEPRERPDGVTPEYAPAIFLSLPISRLACVNDPSGGRHQQALERASRSSLPVVAVDA